MAQRRNMGRERRLRRQVGIRLHRESPKRKQAKQNGRKNATEVQMKAELSLRVGDVICILVDGGSVHPDLL